MKDVVKVIGLLLLGVAMLFLGAILAGTFVWFLWPSVIPAVFPGMVSAGFIVGKISWLAAVGLSWLCGLLIQTTVNYNNK
jgi:hypothetical protein